MHCRNAGIFFVGEGPEAARRPWGRSFAVAVLLAVFCFATYSTTPARAEGGGGAVKTVDSTGFAAIGGSNVAIARDRAVEDALRNALEQTVGALVSSETQVENYEVLKDNIYTRTHGYIKGYNITGEGQVQGLYRVTVRALVAMENLRDNLDAMGLLYTRAGRPRVLFMIAEQNIGREFIHIWWGGTEFKAETLEMNAAETALKDAFLKEGFNVVEAPLSDSELFIPEPLRVVDLTGIEAGRVGMILDAEIVVKGRAIVKQAPGRPDRPLSLYIADITATAVAADSGSVLASASGHGTSRNISPETGSSEALERAAVRASKKLIKEILSRWKGPEVITIKVFNISDYKEVTAFKEMLKRRIRGVGAVYQRSFKEDRAVFQVETKVPATVVADQIARFKLPAVKVVGTTPSSIEAVVGPGR